MKRAIQSMVLAAYRGVQRTGVLETAVGRRMFEGAYRLYKRAWEPDITALRGFVAHGDWIVDVGANVGFFTLQFARWVEGGGRVLAIEPAPENARTLRRTIAATRFIEGVEIIEGVASDAEGELRLALNPHNPADHRIGSAGIQVRSHTLDGLLRGLGGPRVGLVKIDVQGAEMLVLRGARELLSRDRPALMVEIDDGALAAFGSTAAQVIGHLRSLEYELFDLRDAAFATPLSDARAAELRREVGYADFVFVPTRASGVMTSRHRDRR